MVYVNIHHSGQIVFFFVIFLLFYLVLDHTYLFGQNKQTVDRERERERERERGRKRDGGERDREREKSKTSPNFLKANLISLYH